MIAVVVTARPSYARVKTVLEGLDRLRVPFQVYACASALLPKYGRVADVIRTDGYPCVDVLASCEHNSLAGGCLTTAALTHALALVFDWDKPALVVTVADRKETLATAIAASYQHIPLFHLLAGERSGSIDDKVREAVSALASYHACPLYPPAWPHSHTSRMTGCPSVDLALRASKDQIVTLDELGGTGSLINLRGPFVVLLQHPVSDEPQAAEQLEQTMVALTAIPKPILAFWPGEESGSDASAKILRQLKENYLGNHAWHFVRNLPPARFYRLLHQCSCLVGNSSVGVRESSALGTPVVNIGTRQTGRIRAANVLDVGHDVEHIRTAVQAQILRGRFEPSQLYGDGHAGIRIAEWLQEIVTV